MKDGYWERGDGRLVAIGEMNRHHLENAVRILEKRINDLDRQLANFTRTDNSFVKQAADVAGARRALFAAKRDELRAEHARRFPPPPGPETP